MAEDTYLLDHGWAGERDRLMALAGLFDPGTFRHLAATGVAEGWRCLEVGGGTGTVAQWLCDQVGPTGEVVATDLDTGFLSEIDRPNLVVRRHDITRDELEEGAFDLVHTRFVLEHLHSRDVAIRRMARALRPGGWLVLEALQWTSLHASSTRPGHPSVRLIRVISPMLKFILEMFRPAGIGLNVGARLPAEFSAAGLVDVTAEGRCVFLAAQPPASDMIRLTLARARDLVENPPEPVRDAPPWSPAGLLRSATVRRTLAERIDRLQVVVTDPDLWTMMPPVVVATGRSPN